MTNYNYTVVVQPDDPGFHAFVPVLRGCHSWGSTVDEALANIREAIELYLESLREHGEEIPVEPESVRIERIAIAA